MRQDHARERWRHLRAQGEAILSEYRGAVELATNKHAVYSAAKRQMVMKMW